MAVSSTHYVSIQGWMGKAGLSLSGPSLIVYAIIYGFSQDGVTACRCHLSYFQEWADISERTARYIISSLSAAGYIRRTAIGDGRGALVEYRADLDIVAQAQKGAKFAPIRKGAIYDTKGGKIVHKRGQNLPVYNYKIIYNNIFFCAREDALASEEGRKKEIFKLFFFKNAAAPQAELEEFYRVNILGEWTDGHGRKVDTSMNKLLAWADGWSLKRGDNRVSPLFLDAWREIYNEAERLDDPIAPALIDPLIKCDVSTTNVVLHLPKEVADWIEAKVLAKDNRIYDLMKRLVHGRKLSYQLIVS